MLWIKKYREGWLAIGLLAVLCAPSANANAGSRNKVTVFAGPQSLSPRETVFVTVQTTDESEAAYDNETVTLSYMSGRTVKTLTGTTENGLVSFDIKASETSGVMAFTAMSAAGQSSNEALVTVVPGGPEIFALSIKKSEHANRVKISSDEITDRYGNRVSDQSLIKLHWIDTAGLRKTQTTQLHNGQISLEAKCPARYLGDLRLRAVFKTSQYFSENLSALCAAGRG